MKLVSLWFSLILLSCCHSAPAGPPRLPETATFGWRLKGIAESKPESAPEPVRSLGFRRSWRASYEGPGTAQVDVYELKSAAAGLEMTQRWRPAAQTVTVFNPNYFVVVTWKDAGASAVTALVGQVEKALPRSD